MIPLVFDQGLPRRAAEELRRLGWDVVHVGELSMQRAGDPEILALARARGAAAVTLDADFAAVLALTGATAPSVIHVRVERFNAARATATLPAIVESHLGLLAAGCILSVTEAGIRARALPLGSPQTSPGSPAE